MRFFALALTVSFMLVSHSAHAQTIVVQGPEGEPSIEDINRAREAYLEGRNAADERQWSRALDLFIESYQLSGIAPSLVNVAVTYRSVGRYRLARDAAQQVLTEHPDTDEDNLRLAREVIADVSARVAVLELAGLSEETHVLRIDGQSREDPGSRPAEVAVDEGAHTLSVEREGYLPFNWEGEVDGGERELIEVDLEPIPTGTSTAGKVILVTVAVLVAAGLGVGAFYLFRDEGLQPSTEHVVNLP